MNENLHLTYISSVATNSLPSDPSAEINSLVDLEVLTVLHMPIRSAIMVYHCMPDA